MKRVPPLIHAVDCGCGETRPSWVPNYSACSAGWIVGDRRISSLIPADRMLRPQVNKNGYRFVILPFEGRRRTFAVHRLVCAAFHGDPPPDHEVRHLDGCRTNNVASNLRWGTRKENGHDRVIHGTAIAGDTHPLSKVTSDDVREIRRRLVAGESYRVIAKDFPLTTQGIRDIDSGRTWRSVPIVTCGCVWSMVVSADGSWSWSIREASQQCHEWLMHPQTRCVGGPATVGGRPVVVDPLAFESWPGRPALISAEVAPT